MIGKCLKCNHAHDLGSLGYTADEALSILREEGNDNDCRDAAESWLRRATAAFVASEAGAKGVVVKMAASYEAMDEAQLEGMELGAAWALTLIRDEIGRRRGKKR